jgi:hypothetical protein
MAVNDMPSVAIAKGTSCPRRPWLAVPGDSYLRHDP